MEELLQLWRKGERVWDEYKKEHFKLKVLLFVTITDLPGLGSLTGQVTKGYKGCVVCLDDTSAKYLEHSKKMIYMGHHRFLPFTHLYCKNKKSCDGTVEDREQPQFQTGRWIIKIINKVSKVILGKGAASIPTPVKSLWKKIYVLEPALLEDVACSAHT